MARVLVSEVFWKGGVKFGPGLHPRCQIGLIGVTVEYSLRFHGLHSPLLPQGCMVLVI